jgi:hypothetical protein
MNEYEQARPETPEAPPKGWEPYAEECGKIGSAIVRLPSPGATKRDLLLGAGFDPDQWQIVGVINTRRWMRHDQEWLYYYKFDVAEGQESVEDREAHVAELARSIRSYRRKTTLGTGSGAFGLFASDWQIGKKYGRYGTPETKQAVADSIDQTVQRIKNLRKIGRLYPEGFFIGTGDLREGTCGWYSNQLFTIDATGREQDKICRELIAYAVDEMAPLFDVFHISTVGGNHGENRENGRKQTDDGDNHDVANFETVKEAFDRNDPGNLKWYIPRDELSSRINLGGVEVGITHGHLFTSGGKLPQAKALEWWKGQVFGLQAVSAAQILVSSHFHHFSAIAHGPRTHIQTPANDPGSKWFSDSSGMESPAGALTIAFDEAHPLGWTDLEVLGGFGPS